LINNVRTFREFGGGGSAATDLLLSGSTVSPTITGIPGTPTSTFTSGTGTVDISALDDDDWVVVYSVGGGGGGAGAFRDDNEIAGYGKGSGGGGGATISIISKYELGDTLTYSVGAGGLKNSASTQPNQGIPTAQGQTGSPSTVTSGTGYKNFLSAPGGGGGTATGAGTGSGTGGAGGGSSFSWVDADFYYTNVVAKAIVAGGITNIANITQSGGNGAGAGGSSNPNPAAGTGSAWGGAGAAGPVNGNAGAFGRGGGSSANGTAGFIRMYFPR